MEVYQGGESTSWCGNHLITRTLYHHSSVFQPILIGTQDVWRMHRRCSNVAHNTLKGNNNKHFSNGTISTQWPPSRCWLAPQGTTLMVAWFWSPLWAVIRYSGGIVQVLSIDRGFYAWIIVIVIHLNECFHPVERNEAKSLYRVINHPMRR